MDQDGLVFLRSKSEYVRKFLAEAVGESRPISKGHFDALLNRRGVESFDRGRGPAAWRELADHYRALRAEMGLKAPELREVIAGNEAKADQVAKEGAQEDSARWVLGLMVAQEAALFPEVVEVRNLWGGGTMEPDKARAWLLEQSAAEPYDPSIGTFYQDLRTDKVTLTFPAVKEGDTPVSVPVPWESGVTKIAFVWRAANAVSDHTMWHPESCVVFVMCGLSPRYTETAFFQTYFAGNERIPALSRIRIWVDPAMSPKTVMALFAEERKKYLKMHREVDTKARILGWFIGTEYVRNLDAWSQMAAWNKEVKKSNLPQGWRYSELRLFNRDSEDARNRILRPRGLVDAIQRDGHESEEVYEG